MRLSAVEQQNIARTGIAVFSTVLHMENAFADKCHQQRRIAVSLHEIIFCTEIMPAPGWIKQRLLFDIGRCKGETDRLIQNSGIDALQSAASP